MDHNDCHPDDLGESRRPRLVVFAAGLWTLGFTMTCAAIAYLYLGKQTHLDDDASRYLSVHIVVTILTSYALVGIWKRTYRLLRTASAVSMLWALVSLGIITHSLLQATNWGKVVRGLFWDNVLMVTTPSIQLLGAGVMGWLGAIRLRNAATEKQ